MHAFIKRRQELLRVFLKLAVLAPVVLAFVVQFHRYRSPEPTLVFSPTFSSSAGQMVQTVSERPTSPDQTTTILVATFGATALLGFAALLFQFVLRRCEHATTIVFFGVVALLMVVNIASEFLSSGFSADLRDDYAYMLLFFAVSVAGVCFESYRQKRVYETHAA